MWLADFLQLANKCFIFLSRESQLLFPLPRVYILWRSLLEKLLATLLVQFLPLISQRHSQFNDFRISFAYWYVQILDQFAHATDLVGQTLSSSSNFIQFFLIYRFFGLLRCLVEVVHEILLLMYCGSRCSRFRVCHFAWSGTRGSLLELLSWLCAKELSQHIHDFSFNHLLGRRLHLLHVHRLLPVKLPWWQVPVRIWWHLVCVLLLRHILLLLRYWWPRTSWLAFDFGPSSSLSGRVCRLKDLFDWHMN